MSLVSLLRCPLSDAKRKLETAVRIQTGILYCFNSLVPSRTSKSLNAGERGNRRPACRTVSLCTDLPPSPPILKRNNILKLYRKVANITTKNVLRNNFLLAPNEQMGHKTWPNKIKILDKYWNDAWSAYYHLPRPRRPTEKSNFTILPATKPHEWFIMKMGINSIAMLLLCSLPL